MFLFSNQIMFLFDKGYLNDYKKISPNNYYLKYFHIHLIFNNIYKCTHKKDKSMIYCLKTIKLNQQNLDKSFNEASYTMLLSQNDMQNNIVHYYDSFVIKDCLFIVMNWCSCDLFSFLNNRLDNNKPLEESEIKIIMWQLLQGVKYIHSKNFIHNDLKLENILIVKENDLHDIRINDFGLCLEDYPTNKYKYIISGTPDYIGPEIYTKYNEKYNDMWSLGVILYILLTGFFPFQCKMKNFKIYDIHFKNTEWKELPEYTSRSKEVRNLVENLLVIDTWKRWKINRCLNCRWFNDFDPHLIQPHTFIEKQKNKGNELEKKKKWTDVKKIFNLNCIIS